MRRELVAFLLQGITLGLSAAVSPGPFQAYLLSQALRDGWRRTLPAALAPLLSDGPIILLLLLLLTQLPPRFLQIIQIGGGIFLIYLAWGAGQTFWRGATAVQPSDNAGQRQNFLKAALINALSPGPYIFWGVLAGPILLRGWRMGTAVGLSFMVGFYAALIGGFGTLILLFATARQLGPHVTRWLNGVSALALFLFGLYQLGQGLFGG